MSLRIKTSGEYQEKYKNDPQLPAQPDSYYSDFPGWGNFCRGDGHPRPRKRTECYLTLKEAHVAVLALRVRSRKEYAGRFREDPKLPANPHLVYDDFPGWSMFLQLRYSTWQEASVVAQSLKMSSVTDYQMRKHGDPRLPANPHTFYPDFPGYAVFLGTRYSTWQEASNAAIRLGVRSRRDYPARYKDDSKLVSNPNKAYPDFPGWKKFLGKE